MTNLLYNTILGETLISPLTKAEGQRLVAMSVAHSIQQTRPPQSARSKLLYGCSNEALAWAARCVEPIELTPGETVTDADGNEVTELRPLP